MVIIADCGSTKCDWLLSHGGRDQHLENTVGFSPFFHSTAEIKEIIETQLLPKLKNETVDAVYFYGTGVHDAQRAEIVNAALKSAFPKATTLVEHDLLGAARAVCGHSAGIACILGTGSNSCYFDGVKILDNVPSLGWLLGDEGSGPIWAKHCSAPGFTVNYPLTLTQPLRKLIRKGRMRLKTGLMKKGPMLTWPLSPAF
jgi:N-acetylglucosamine kinase-like BadF-type ATPase